MARRQNGPFLMLQLGTQKIYPSLKARRIIVLALSTAIVYCSLIAGDSVEQGSLNQLKEKIG